MDLRAVIFVPALAGSVIFGFLFALFAAHHYLTAMQSTGSGSRDVVWVSEPIVDHFWKVFYLAWLIGLWLGPAYLIGRAYAGGSDSAWVRLAVPLAVFWLCYPVSQLSSLGGPTIWLPLHPDVFARLVQKPGVVLGFFALSAAALAVFGVAFKWTFLTAGQYELLFVGAPLLIVSGLVYARLIGRLAFVLAFTKPLLARKKKRKKDREEEAGEGADARRPDGDATGEAADGSEERFAQPSELPPIETPDEGPLTGYDVRSDDVPAAARKPRRRVRAEAVESEPEEEQPRRRRRVADDEDDAPYEARPAEVVSEGQAPKEVVKPSAVEMRLLSAKDDAPRAPRQAWSPQLLAFLGQPETWSVVVVLSGMCVLAGLMVRIARAFNPVSGS